MIKVVDTIEGFGSLREDWNRLVEASGQSYFLRWEWLWEWWQAYATSDFRLCILLVYNENGLQGIGPFYIKPRTWKSLLMTRRIMFIGTTEDEIISEYMDIIASPEHELSAVESIVSYLSENDICDEVYLQKVDASSCVAVILKEISSATDFRFAVTARFESPYIKLPREHSDLGNCMSGSVLRKIRSDERKLSQYPDVRFRTTRNHSELEENFQELVRLHQLRWEQRKMPGSFASAKFLSFQKGAVRAMLENGHLDLRLLSSQGRNIAAIYNINYGNKVYYYQSGLDTSFDGRISPGYILHSRCIAHAIKAGFTEYDFLLMGGSDSYKKRWTDTGRPLYDVYLVKSRIMKFVDGLVEKASDCYGLFSRYRTK